MKILHSRHTFVYITLYGHNSYILTQGDTHQLGLPLLPRTPKKLVMETQSFSAAFNLVKMGEQV